MQCSRSNDYDVVIRINANTNLSILVKSSPSNHC